MPGAFLLGARIPGSSYFGFLGLGRQRNSLEEDALFQYDPPLAPQLCLGHLLYELEKLLRGEVSTGVAQPLRDVVADCNPSGCMKLAICELDSRVSI